MHPHMYHGPKYLDSYGLIIDPTQTSPYTNIVLSPGPNIPIQMFIELNYNGTLTIFKYCNT